MSDLRWLVAHTRPRCEKKLVEVCAREHLSATLPCYRAAHKYRGKTVVLRKPLFPGYVFLQFAAEQRRKIYHSDFFANLLEVPDLAVIPVGHTYYMSSTTMHLTPGLPLRVIQLREQDCGQLRGS